MVILGLISGFFVRFRKTQGEKNSSSEKTQRFFSPKTQAPGGFQAIFFKTQGSKSEKLKKFFRFCFEAAEKHNLLV